MRVDASLSLGALEDGRLSLAEAIGLATGVLTVDDLDAAERAQIEGEPGPGRRDRIWIAPGLTILVERGREPADAVLPLLSDAGDVIEGNGAVLDASPLGGAPVRALEPSLAVDGRTDAAPLMVVSASEVMVTGVRVRSFPGIAIVVRGKADVSLHGIEIRDNHIEGLGPGSPSSGITVGARANASNQVIERVRVVGNEIVDVVAGVAVLGAFASGPGALGSGNRIEGLEIAQNRVERPVEGILLYAAQSFAPARASGNRLRGVQIRENEVLDNSDVAILALANHTDALAGEPGLAGSVGDNALEDVRVEGNDVRATATAFNSGMYLSAGLAFGGGTSERGALRRLTILGNHVEGQATGLFLVAAAGDRCGAGCTVSGHVVSGVDLRGNEWRDVTTGILLVGGGSFEAAALVRGNALSRVRVTSDLVDAVQAGLAVYGSFAVSLPDDPSIPGGTGWPGRGLPADLFENVARDVEVDGASITADAAVQISAGLTFEAEDLIRAARIEDARVRDTTVAGRSAGVFVAGGTAVGDGAVLDSVVARVALEGNRDPSGGIASVLVVDEVAVGSPGGRVTGNRAFDVEVEAGEPRGVLARVTDACTVPGSSYPAHQQVSEHGARRPA